mmetsp:Transcript_6915/g.9316  ORF Transcript_6915/g.9316 Transcript_6915/m.9316 type:complete len:350 (-) Transcript_6915:63-1112(-)
MLFYETNIISWTAIVTLLALSSFSLSYGNEILESPPLERIGVEAATTPTTDPALSSIGVDTEELQPKLLQLPAECLHPIEGEYDGDIRYFNVILEIAGICDDSEIIDNKCNFEQAITEYFNEALSCLGPGEEIVYFDEGSYIIETYSDVLIDNVISSTTATTDECTVDVSLTAEVILTEALSNIGDCGAGCSQNSLPSQDDLADSSFFPFAGGSFRRRLTQKSSKSSKSSSKSGKSSSKGAKSSKSSHSATPPTTIIQPSQYPSIAPSIYPTRYPTFTPDPVEDAPSPNACQEPLFLLKMDDNGFGVVNGVQFKEIAMLQNGEASACDTLFACIRTFCADPEDDVCYGL